MLQLYKQTYVAQDLQLFALLCEHTGKLDLVTDDEMFIQAYKSREMPLPAAINTQAHILPTYLKRPDDEVPLNVRVNNDRENWKLGWALETQRLEATYISDYTYRLMPRYP